ncbi:MAG: NUDIX domain-containing protein [Rhodopseudomonas sp.]|uniref:NUDIX domain-containing protein n=1 Tax=Rhodopseudomonas sp. TaxID=1078 RepID=UPI00184E6237|nr:NUDIX domain-containing protein [Rhodopseudomonas sp.]NVN87640.1 NUDIX domain-containing protein [Rhodopseudomonas sp.]
MSDGDDSINMLADGKADVTISAPMLIGQGFMAYERYEVSLQRDGEPPLLQRRDVLRASRVAAVLAIDLGRDQVALIRQFRLPAHLATGRGDMVEIVAGRIEPGETPDAAARRECLEEIGVAPQRLVELFSVLATPGFTDEYVTFFAGFIDCAEIPSRGGVADEDEDTHPFVVSIDQALAALDRGEVLNALLVSALQWLALHRGRLRDYLNRAV